MNGSYAERLRDARRTLLGDVGAFLPQRVPLDRLPEPLQPYLEACACLPQHYPSGKGGVRAFVGDRFARFDPQVAAAMDRLSLIEQWTLLTAFAALGHTYRWDTVPPRPERLTERSVTLPEGLDRPWRGLAKRLGQPRVGTMWSLHLSNWRLVDRPGGARYQVSDLTVGRLRVAHQWLDPPAASHLEQFSLTFVLMEARGAVAVDRLIETIEAVERGDLQEVGYRLDSLEQAIHDMSKAFAQSIRDVHVDPRTWLELVQPTFAWAAEDDGQELPGPNGMQMPTLHCLDAALSVPSSSVLARQTLAARAHMPPAHRRFVTLMDETRGLLRRFVEQTGARTLCQRYNGCVVALNKFRTAHRARGARYIEAGRHGSSGRVSTGMGIAWRPEDESSPSSVIPDKEDPLVEFERRMTERIDETRSALVIGDDRGDEPTVENTFRFLRPEDRAALIESAPSQSFGAGEVIIRQGARRQALFVVEDGFVRIEVRARGRRVVIARLWPGEVFGEISFLSNAEATAWAIAEEDTQVRVLDRAHVYAIIARSPTFGMPFYQSLAVQLASRLVASTTFLAKQSPPSADRELESAVPLSRAGR
jgi:CRP-like cAMP-binding protein